MLKLVSQLRSGSKMGKANIRDGFEERVVQVRRVTKVIKGGKQINIWVVIL